MTEDKFEINQLYRRLASANYTGCADYIRQFTFNDPTKRRQMYEAAKVYERDGANLQKIIERAGDNEELRQKLTFNYQRKVGYWGNDSSLRNSYSNAYVDAINNLGSKNDFNSTYLDFYINTSNKTKFKSIVGDTQFNETTRRGWTENGTYRVTISDLLEDNGFDNLMSALDEGCTPTREKSWRLGSGVKETPGYSVYAVSDKGERSSYSEYGNLMTIRAMTDDAQKAEDNILGGDINTSFVGDIMAKGYMCNAQMKIINAVSTGQLDKELASWYLTRIDDYYKEGLAVTDLTKYDIFATEANGETMNFNSITDSGEKTELTHMLRSAMKEGRVHYRAAAGGGRTGTLITIVAALDKEGNPIENGKSDISIFVPGLFDDDAKDVMNEDIDARVYVKQNEHMQLGHDYMLGDGSRIANFNGDGTAVKYETIGDKEIEIPLSSEEVTSLIRKEEMTKAAEDRMLDDDLNAYELRVKDYTKDQLAALKENEAYGMTDDKIQSVAEQYATQIMYYLEGIQSEDQLPTPEAKNRLQSDINEIAKRLIKKVKKQ